MWCLCGVVVSCCCCCVLSDLQWIRSGMQCTAERERREQEIEWLLGSNYSCELQLPCYEVGFFCRWVIWKLRVCIMTSCAHALQLNCLNHWMWTLTTDKCAHHSGVLRWLDVPVYKWEFFWSTVVILARSCKIVDLYGALLPKPMICCIRQYSKTRLPLVIVWMPIVVL